MYKDQLNMYVLYIQHIPHVIIKNLGRRKWVDFISHISEGREGLGEPWLTLSGKMIDRRQSFDLIIPFFFKFFNRLGG